MLNPYEGGVFRVTSIYGSRNIGNGTEFHKGLDLVGESSKKLIAIADGVIQQSRLVPKSTGDLTWQWGNYICLKADTGELIYYCHLAERLVSQGQRVKKGDVIGIEGSTGYSFGSHCHLEIRTGANITTSTVNTPAFTGIPNVVGEYSTKETVLMDKTVFLSFGHGGTDPGAVANSLKEKDINLITGLECKAVLERHGVKVICSRIKDENDPVQDEVKEANASGAPLAVSFHANAGGGDGWEGYYYIGTAAGKKLCELAEKYVKQLGQNSRGIKSGNHLYFVKNTTMPAVLFESFFIDNAKDKTIGDTVAEQKAFGVAYAKAILEYFNITYKENTTVKQDNTPKKDNTPDSYAKDAVNWAIKKGIIAGDGNGDYKLHSNVTRQDALVFLYRALN